MKTSRLLLAAASCAALLLPAALAHAAPAATASASALAVRTVDRGRFTVEVSGEGPDVILIPGLASSRAVYDGLMPSLKGYRVHRVQIAGFAGLPAGPNAEGPVVQPFIEELARYIADEKLEKPAVIGHSLGGFSALSLAQQRPDLVGRAMVIDAFPFFAVLMDPKATAESVRPQADAFRDMILKSTPEAFEKGQQGTAMGMMMNAAKRPTMVEWSMATDRKVMAQAAWDIITSDGSKGLAGMTVPLTVLYAWDQSMGQPAERLDGMYGTAYAAAPNKKLVRIDGSYHFIMFDQPERFSQEVAAFLAGHQ